MARQKLTDKQRKKIIAEYIDCGNYSAVAKRHGVSVNTVKRTVSNDKDTANKVKRKKEENTANALDWLSNNTQNILSKCEMIIDSIDETTIKSVPLNLRTTAFGTLLDKAILPYAGKLKQDNEANGLEAAIKSHWGVKDDNT